MSSYILAAKRILRSVGFWLFMAVTAVAVFASPLIGRTEAVPPAGIVDMDKSEISGRVVAQLTRGDFILCENEEDLKNAISAGSLNCGVVLPLGFGESLKDGTLSQSVRFITSATSFVPEIYSNSAAAAIFAVRAPYVAADALEHTGIDEKEVVQVYDDLASNGYLFSFDIVIENARISHTDERARTYTVATVGLLMFALLVYGSSETVSRDCGALVRRIGVRKAIWHVLVPSVTVRALLVMLGVCTSLFITAVVTSSEFCIGLMLPACAYALVLSAFAMILYAVFEKPSHIQVVSCFVLLVSLVLCPIYFDAALVLPWISYVRNAVPVYWIWIAEAHTVGCVVAALIMLAAALWLIALRWRRRIPDLSNGRV